MEMGKGTWYVVHTLTASHTDTLDMILLCPRLEKSSPRIQGNHGEMHSYFDITDKQGCGNPALKTL